MPSGILKVRVRSAACAVLAALAMALTVTAVMSRVFTTSLQFDDALHACVAKNLARAGGYRTCHDPIPFGPSITVGPVLVSSCSALISLFGTRYWVPGLTTALYSLMLLFASALLMRRSMEADGSGRRVSYMASLVAFALLPLVTSEGLRCNDAIRLRLWCLLLGEVPASLFVVTGALVVFRHGRLSSMRTTACAGLLLGLAISTKVVTALCVVGVVLASAVSLAHARLPARASLGRLGALLGGVAVPLAMFEAIRIISLHGLSEWMRLKHAERWAFIRGGSGLEYYFVSRSKLSLLCDNVVRKWDILVSQYCGSPTASVLITAGLLLLAARGLWGMRRSSATTLAGTALIWGYLLTLAWWLIASPSGWLRYLMPGLVCAWCGLCCLISSHERAVPWRLLAAVPLLLILAARIPEVPRTYLPRLHREPRLNALLETVTFLSDSALADVTLVGCRTWMNLDVEYLLPGVCRFKECLPAGGERVVEGRRVYLVRSEYWNWDNEDDLQQIQDHCEQNIVFQRGPFVVSECPDLEGLAMGLSDMER